MLAEILNVLVAVSVAVLVGLAICVARHESDWAARVEAVKAKRSA